MDCIELSFQLWNLEQFGDALHVVHWCYNGPTGMTSFYGACVGLEDVILLIFSVVSILSRGSGLHRCKVGERQ